MTDASPEASFPDENAERLEAAGKELHPGARRAALLDIGIGVLFFVGFWGGMFLAIRLGMSVESGFSRILGMACLGVGLLGLVFYSGGGLLRMLRPVPRAPRAPEKAVRRFFSIYFSTLQKHFGSLGAVHKADAYVCLLDVAKKEFGDFGHFEKEIDRASMEVAMSIKKLGKNTAVTEVRFEIEDIARAFSSSQGTVGLAVRCRVDVYTGSAGNPHYPLTQIGSLAYEGSKQVTEVGGRYYLTEGAFPTPAEFSVPGTPEPEKPRERSEHREHSYGPTGICTKCGAGKTSRPCEGEAGME